MCTVHGSVLINQKGKANYLKSPFGTVHNMQLVVNQFDNLP